MPSDTSHPGATGANARYVRGLLDSYHLPLVADTPEARAAHDQHLMDAVAALHPEDDFEARLAVRIVAMGVHADDALRSAGLAAAAADPMEVRRCRAQAVSMARQADSSLRTLRRMQADRDKALAAMHPAAMERAGYWFHEISVPAPAPAPAELDEVELFEAMHPDRAARIRAAGGLPPDLDFGPPPPHIVAGLLRTAGKSHAMRHNPTNRDSETESSHRLGQLPAVGVGGADPASERPATGAAMLVSPPMFKSTG
ncbi:MAG TPA: hypothetical protein VKI44_42320 [Acetobacteraceae bacterium]|nr:hypothetical protein [Acetobacteraceae bacterium]